MLWCSGKVVHSVVFGLVSYLVMVLLCCSGMGVALSILGNNTASLVGVAISASLLPPAVSFENIWARDTAFHAFIHSFVHRPKKEKE